MNLDLLKTSLSDIPARLETVGWYSSFTIAQIQDHNKLPESTRKLIELSDEITALNRHILERAKIGAEVDPKIRERLAELMEELLGPPAADEPDKIN